MVHYPSLLYLVYKGCVLRTYENGIELPNLSNRVIPVHQSTCISGERLYLPVPVYGIFHAGGFDPRIVYNKEGSRPWKVNALYIYSYSPKSYESIMRGLGRGICLR